LNVRSRHTHAENEPYHVFGAARDELDLPGEGHAEARGDIALVGRDGGVARDLEGLADEMAKLGVGQLQDLLCGHAGVEHAKVEVVQDDGERQAAREGLLLRVHERVVGGERADVRRARGELGPSPFPAANMST
jgi:hypothetical protein